MSESREYKTIVNCTKKLETAFRSLDRDIVHYLFCEGFITQEERDEVLEVRSMLSSYQKAERLVTSIRRNVELNPQNFQTILNHLRRSGKYYESIVNILDEEYQGQRKG